MKSWTDFNINELTLFDMFGSPCARLENVKQICRESEQLWCCLVLMQSVGSVEGSVQLFLLFLHNRKCYLLAACLIGHNLSSSFQDKVCNILLPVLCNCRCKKKKEKKKRKKKVGEQLC